MAEETVVSQQEERRATVIEHLKELRKRILYSGASIIVGLIGGMIFAEKIIWLLVDIAPADIEFQAITPLENVQVWFQVGLTSGIIVAMPFLVYQLFAFVGPGLTGKEKRFIFSIIPAITFLFLAGVAFAYFVALPLMMDFLYHFMEDIAPVHPQISSHISLVTRVLLFCGIIFETPLVIMGMAKLGIVSPKWLASRRKWWILLAFVLAAVISPTMDIYSQTVLAVPMILLMELGILLARLVYKKS
ncbi:MAG: twin-arginine translocase subunit TatC [Dehalococcoidia bacterium]|nr:twin-arginine translocase subunit TatC [Dehalococcoidia bacterium]